MNFLFDAIKTNSPLRLKQLLDAGSPVDQCGSQGETPLMVAVTFRRTACAKVLLDHGANVNAADDTGRTVLMAAIPDIESVWGLLLLGANPEAVDNEGRTVLHYAQRNGAKGTHRLIRNAINAKRLADCEKRECELKVLTFLEKELRE